MIENQADDLPKITEKGDSAGQPRISRRKMLKYIGIGTGATLIIVSVTDVWRAVDRGVLSMGQGVAYEPWTTWKTDKVEGPLELVRAGILAANTHNTQPWLFRLTANRIDILADLTRRIPANDPNMREFYISLGCALENILLAAEAKGYTTQVTLLPDPATPTYVARIELAKGTANPGDLYRAIPDRHTNRFAYDTGKSVSLDLLAAMQALSPDANVRLFWLTTQSERQKFTQLTLEATIAMNADAGEALETHNWTRLTSHEIEQHRDGLTLEASGLSDLMQVLGKIASSTSIEQEGQYWLQNTREVQLPTAAAFGLLTIRDAEDRTQQIHAGQFWQRLHLWATAHSIAMQPLDQIPQRADREQQLSLTPHFAPALQELVADPQWKVALSFRTGYANKSAPASPRRSVGAVVGS